MEITQSKTWHAYFRNTCWTGETATWLSASPTQSGTGQCIGPNTECAPGFQAYASWVGSQTIWWKGTVSNQYYTGLGFCAESTYDELTIDADPHYPDDAPCSPYCKPDGEPCSSTNECCSNWCSSELYVCGDPSPIMIDIKGSTSNYRLTAPAQGVQFDIDNDGDHEQVSWPSADSEVAFLVLDRNGNGTIDNGSELFGTATPKSDGHLAANGFEALLDLDGGAHGSDGKIDATDPTYFQLRLWFDRNHNGVSEPSELVSLGDAGVTTIFTAYRETSRTDKDGNAYRYKGQALIRKNRNDVPRQVFDVYLQVVQRTN
jgi:hypothetical protein